MRVDGSICPYGLADDKFDRSKRLERRVRNANWYRVTDPQEYSRPRRQKHHIVSGQQSGMSSDYARICCTSIGNADYMDLHRNGTVEITPKGWQELDKRGWKKEEKVTEQQLKCPYCGGSNQPGAVFCVHCKRWLGSGQTYTLR